MEILLPGLIGIGAGGAIVISMTALVHRYTAATSPASTFYGRMVLALGAVLVVVAAVSAAVVRWV